MSWKAMLKKQTIANQQQRNCRMFYLNKLKYVHANFDSQAKREI